MSENYTVKHVEDEVNRWIGKFGPMVTYKMLLEETGEEVIDQNKKPDSPPPKVGDVIYADIERNAFGAKLKVLQKPDYSGSKSDKSTDYEPGTNARWAVGMAYRAFIQATGSPEGTDGEFPFEAVKQHALALVKMFDEVKSRGGQETVAPTTPQTLNSAPTKQAPEPFAIKKKLAEADWVPGDEEIHE